MERSRPALYAALAGLAIAGVLMVRLNGFEATPALSRASSGGSTDDTSSGIAYAGRWERGTFRGAFNGSLTYSDVPGATARWQFEGTAFDYVYTKAFNRGLAVVAIDGSERGTVDLYAPAIEWQAVTTFGGLPAGRHTVEIRVAGRRDPASSGSFVDIDALAGR
jgi:bacillopeptidase F